VGNDGDVTQVLYHVLSLLRSRLSRITTRANRANDVSTQRGRREARGLYHSDGPLYGEIFPQNLHQGGAHATKMH